MNMIWVMFMISNEKLKEQLKEIDEYFDNITTKELDEKLEKYVIESYAVNEELENQFFSINLYDDSLYSILQEDIKNDSLQYQKFINKGDGTRCQKAELAA